jgi:hypothetical protein
MEIIFTNTREVSDYYPPTPASQSIPDWYKKLESYLPQGKTPVELASPHDTPATIKRCMPVFDALTAGYILYTSVDVYVEQKNGAPYYSWPDGDIIGFHPVDQAGDHPVKTGNDFPKWNNPWGIKTPKGYSVLITQPVHRESPFTILDGVVDTDTYTSPVLLPFVLKDPSFKGMILAGTPMAQVIPFKRENWEMKIGGDQEVKEAKKVDKALAGKFFDRYKTLFRSTKSYK